jgi:hypothetical protein
LNIIRIRERNITLNKLNCIENYENEEIKLNLPKIIDEKKIAFVQYFGKYVDMYYNEKIIKEEYLGNKFDVYIFDKDIEPYGIREIVTPYKAYFYISYFSFKDYTDNLTKIPKNCGFKISKTDDSLNKIIIDFDTICDKTMYKYYVFIDYNISKYKEFNLIELYYEKDINKDIKYYEFQKTGSGTIEVKDSFENGKLCIIIVGQDTKGFNRFVYYSTTFKYTGDYSLALTIVITIPGVIILSIVIICVIRYIKRKRRNNKDEEKKTEILYNQKDDKKYADFSSDFKYLSNASDEKESKDDKYNKDDKDENDYKDEKYIKDDSDYKCIKDDNDYKDEKNYNDYKDNNA